MKKESVSVMLHGSVGTWLNGVKTNARSKKFYNKCSKNSRSQIVFRTDIFRKLTLGAPVYAVGTGTC